MLLPVRRAASIIALLATAGCGDATKTAGSAHYVRRDSAGTEVVENFIPQWAESPHAQWQVAATPRLRIGATLGDSRYELHSITNAVVLRNGAVLVTLGILGEARLYDPLGTYVKTVGRLGSGPGEFRVAQNAFQRIDGMLQIWDGLSGRLSIFDENMEYQESFAFPAISGMSGTFLAGFLADGRPLVRAGQAAFRNVEGTQRDPQYVVLYSLDGEQCDTLAMLRGREQFHVHTNGYRARNLLILGRSSHAAAGPSSIVYGDNDTFEFRVLTADGMLARIVRLDEPPVQASREYIQQRRDRMLADISQALPPPLRDLRRRAALQMPARETFPAYETIHVDREGNVWLERPQVNSESASKWAVFRSDGVYLGNVDIPGHLTVRQIGRNYVAVTGRDEWDAEFVAILDLMKPAVR